MRTEGAVTTKKIYNLKILINDRVLYSGDFSSAKDINNTFPNIPYHTIRKLISGHIQLKKWENFTITKLQDNQMTT